MNHGSWRRHLAAALLLGVLAACGGGDKKEAPSLAVDFAQRRFVGLRGVPLGPQQVSVRGSGSGSYYLGVGATPAGFWDVTWQVTGERTGVVTLRPAEAADPARMSAGLTTGELLLLLCDDQACSSVAASARVALEADIAAVIGGPLALSAYEGLEGAPVDLTVVPATAGPTVLVAPAPTTPLPWLTLSRSDPAVVRATASAAGVTAGSYSGQVLVTRPGMAGSLGLATTLQVAPGTVPLPGVSVTVDAATQAAALSGTLPVGFQPGLAPAWTASSDQAWLRVQAPGTAGAGSLAWSIDQAALAALPNWAAATATVTVRPAGLAPVTSTVTLDKRLPEVSFAGGPLLADHATDVRVYGRGLSQLATAGALSVGASTGLGGTIASDREARLTALSLPAGRHLVAAPNALGIATRTAPLDAFAAGALPEGVVAHTGSVLGAAVDLARGQVLVSKSGKVVRFRPAGAASQVDETAVTDLVNLALAPDGGTLYGVTGVAGRFDVRHTLLQLDPATLAIRSTHLPVSSLTELTSFSSADRGPAFTADGRLWFATSSWSEPTYFEPATQAFAVLRPSGSSLFIDGPRHYASADGSRLLVGATSGLSPHAYRPFVDAFVQPSAAPRIGEAALSRDGARVVADAQLYDTDTWTHLGEPFSAPASNEALGRAALSPDGRRVYRAVHLLQAGASSGLLLRIEVYDATAVAAGTSSLVKLGEVPVSAAVSSCGPFTSDGYDCATATRLLMSPLGDAVVVLGSLRLQVVAIPAALSGLGVP